MAGRGRDLLIAALLLGGAAQGSAWAQTPAAPLAAAGIGMSDMRPVEVDSEGSGLSRDSAIAKALANAIAQETGTTVAEANLTGDATAQTELHEQLQSSVPGTAATSGPRGGAGSVPQQHDTNESHNETGAGTVHATGNAVIAFSGGRVLRYSVLSVAADAHGLYTARVHAVLELYRRQASAADRRKSIAVTQIASPGAPALGDNLHDQLIIDLTQANRFAVVDRSHDDDYANEIGMIQNGDASPAARAHAGQALGADFILTGQMHMTGPRTTGHAAHTTEDTIELTGEVVSHTSASTLHTIPGAASAEFQVIEVATRQIVMADRMNLAGASVEALAQHITDALIGTIYPPRLIRSDDPTALVISQGGSGMHAGARFKLMSQGGEMFDPYTQESLGRIERMSGVVEITDVEPRISYARLVDGAIPAGPDVVLRPVAAPPPPAPATRIAVRHRGRAAAAEPAADDNSAGVRLPGDR